MASRDRSGLNGHQRERFLREHGFEKVRSAKGSHAVWEHAALKELSRTHKVSIPANILSGGAQCAYELILPEDPASGTWKKLEKQAEWCAETVKLVHQTAAHEQMRQAMLREFHAAVEEVCDWKKRVKHWVKSGLDPAKAPQAPESYRASEGRITPRPV